MFQQLSPAAAIVVIALSLGIGTLLTLALHRWINRRDDESDADNCDICDNGDFGSCPTSMEIMEAPYKLEPREEPSVADTEKFGQPGDGETCWCGKAAVQMFVNEEGFCSWACVPKQWLGIFTTTEPNESE